MFSRSVLSLPAGARARFGRLAAVSLAVAIVATGVSVPLSASADAIYDGSIAGTVVDSVTGAPLAGVQVKAVAIDHGPFEVQLVTDSAGHYSFTNMLRDGYIISYTDPTGDHRRIVWEHAATEEDASVVTVDPDPAIGQLQWQLHDIPMKPYVTGTVTLNSFEPIVGKTLTTTTTSPVATMVPRFQWWRDNMPIDYATQSSYKLTLADHGANLLATVVFTAPGYVDTVDQTAGTGPIAYGPTVAPDPTISGSTVVGSTLSANPGAWTPELVSPQFQWYREGEELIGETGNNYELTNDDAASTITVTVRGYASDGSVLYRTSAPTTVISGGTFGVDSTSMTGTQTVGGTLTVAVNWSPDPDTQTYQWYRNGVAINGSTSATRTLNSLDGGATLTAAVTANGQYYNATSAVVTTATISKVLTATPVPTISGTALVGKVLTANPGSWSPSPVVLKYQWFRDGRTIIGSTASTYTTKSLDKGTKTTVKVTGSKAGYAPVTKTSAGLTIK